MKLNNRSKSKIDKIFIYRNLSDTKNKHTDTKSTKYIHAIQMMVIIIVNHYIPKMMIKIIANHYILKMMIKSSQIITF